MTEAELKEIERALLRKRVYEILTQRKSQQIHTAKAHEKSVAPEPKPEQEPERKQVSSEEKYSSSFESVESSSEESGKKPDDERASDSVQNDEDLQDPDSKVDHSHNLNEHLEHELPENDENQSYSCDFEESDNIKNVSDQATIKESGEDSKEANDDDVHEEDIPETPPVPDTPPLAPDAAKMLSTIEEVTTIADTEEDSEHLEEYSDPFVSSNISDTVEAAPESSSQENSARDILTDEASENGKVEKGLYETPLVQEGERLEEEITKEEPKLESLVETENQKTGGDQSPVQFDMSSSEEERSIVQDLIDDIIESGVLSSDNDEKMVVNENDDVIETGELLDDEERDETDGPGPAAVEGSKDDKSVNSDIDSLKTENELLVQSEENIDLEQQMNTLKVSLNQPNEKALKIQILDSETCNLTPEKRSPSDNDAKDIIKVSPSDQRQHKSDDSILEMSVLTTVGDHDHHVRLSDGELLVQPQVDSSEGELSLGGDTSHLSVRTAPVLLDSSSSSGSWSEGEWRASPNRMRRLINMAAAFRMIKD